MVDSLDEAGFIRWSFMFLFLFVSMIFFVAFGQITVRKLRKNPKTKDVLGISFASGWEILNAAHALSVPRSISRKLERGALSYLYANSDVLYENTSVVDRILARILFYSMVSTTILIVVEILIER